MDLTRRAVEGRKAEFAGNPVDAFRDGIARQMGLRAAVSLDGAVDMGLFRMNRASRLAWSWMLGMFVCSIPALALSEEVHCDPEYDPSITSPETAISGWPDRPATSAEIGAYVLGLAAETDRVVTLPFGSSVNGAPLYYSLVGEPGNVAAADQIAAEQTELRDPRVTDAPRAAEIAATLPAIAWYAGNVHGNETSGADAALRIMYDLAARTDCEAEAIRASLLVGVIPSQNPDGREANARSNEYGFDLNRDWLAQTQAETRSKLEVLVRYPPVVFVDAHEMSGSEYFFPPFADPVHHEVSPESLHWINDLFGDALVQTFEEGQDAQPGEWSYFNFDPYDLFVPHYGDSVPTLAFTAAGMTFEKGSADPARQRFEEHFAAGWTALRTAAGNKAEILQQHYEAHLQALSEGEAGTLGENAVYDPMSPPASEVPSQTLRHYFLRSRRAAGDVDRLVARLLQLGVEVYRLEESVRVAGLGGYGRRARVRRLHAGDYWIPMAQPQKRWVQAVLGEDGYPAVPIFFDVSAWSNPLLMNLEAAHTGAELAGLKEKAVRVEAIPAPVPLDPAAFYGFAGDTARSVGAALALAGQGLEVRRLPRRKKVGRGERLDAGSFVVVGGGAQVSSVLSDFGVVASAHDGSLPAGTSFALPKVAVYASFGEATRHVEFFLDEVIRVPWTAVTGGEVASGRLTNEHFDAFLVPGVFTFDLEAARSQLESWIAAGGVFVGTARPFGIGGTAFAVASGWTTASTSMPDDLDVPGTLFRVKLKKTSPLALGAGKQSYWFHLGEEVLSRSRSGTNVGRFPSRPWYSGYAAGTKALARSAALVDERLGDGRVVLFSGEPNFRAATDGTQLLLSNALTYPRRGGARAGTDVRAADTTAARAGTRAPAIGPGRPLRIRVPIAQEQAAMAVLGTYTSEIMVHAGDSTVVFVIPNPEGLPVDAHPFSRLQLPALEEAGVQVVYAAL